jgi:hypothetical protein
MIEQLVRSHSETISRPPHKIFRDVFAALHFKAQDYDWCNVLRWQNLLLMSTHWSWYPASNLAALTASLKACVITTAIHNAGSPVAEIILQIKKTPNADATL